MPILVHEEGIDERIALIVERQLRLAAFVRDRVGVRADRVSGHVRRGFSRFAAVDLCAGNGRLVPVRKPGIAPSDVTVIVKGLPASTSSESVVIVV